MVVRPKWWGGVAFSSLVFFGLTGQASSRVLAVASGSETCREVAADTPSRVLERRVLFLGFADETPKRLQDLAHNGIGGFFIMGSRSNAASLRKLQAQLVAIDAGTSSGSLRPFVAVDEEGGRVQRLKVLGALPSARAMGGLSPAGIAALASAHSAKMHALVPTGGINMDFAPDVDLDDRTSGIIADRSFSSSPKKAWTAAKAFANGLATNGILPVYKHFPGHGSASGDSHKLLPTTPPLSELEKHDLLPFKSAITANPAGLVVMMGHLVVPGLTAANTPASWSPAAYEYLRVTLGLNGMVVTDDLAMSALAAETSYARRAIRALSAGADMVLISTTVSIEKTLDELDVEAAHNPAFREALIAANQHVRAYGCSKLGLAS